MRLGRRYAVVFVMLGAMSFAVAQDTADIVVGGEIVARVRDQGTYESVQHRAAAADEAINQILASTEDPASLEVSLEQVDGMWTILLDGKAVLSVYPAEAEANGMTPEMLGSIWVRKFRDSLPDASAVEVTDIEAPVRPAQPMEIAEEPVIDSPTVTVERPTTVTETPAAEAPRAPVAEVLEVPTTPPAQRDEVVAGQGARLLILESFNRARDLPEDDYLVRREAMADRLFDQLVQVITEGGATGRIETVPTPTPTPVRPPTPPTDIAETEIAAPPPAVTVERPPLDETTGAMARLQLSDAGRQKIVARIPAGDPSYANVVQKVAIRAKFQAASEAYRGIVASDPSAAAQAREVLGAARAANTAERFDTAEQYLDTALHILGVTEWEHNLESAMRDLGVQ